MALNLVSLDGHVRDLMLQEINLDIQGGILYLSDNLSPEGKQDYPALLIKASMSGDSDSLASDIHSRLNAYEKPRRLPNGSLSKAPVMRVNAHTMLAEGEFNRFYIRAVCLLSIKEYSGTVEVYRAKEVSHSRSESERKIGSMVSAEKLLDDLRGSVGIDTALGLPAGPNSGLTVKLC